MATIQTQGVEATSNAAPAERLGDVDRLIELQRQNARFMAQASQIVLHAMQDLARRQADALQTTLDELAGAPGGHEGGLNGGMLGDVQRQYLRASVRGFAAQIQLGLEGAVSTNAATLALLEEQLSAMPEGAERHRAAGGPSGKR
jgi:hypothetical protein